MYHNLGSGQHFDAPRERPTAKTNRNKHDMVVEVTTDAAGAVVSVSFIRSSGSEVIDAYVSDSIHTNWPQVPSRISKAALTFYSMAEGFSQPKVLSWRPAP